MHEVLVNMLVKAMEVAQTAKFWPSIDFATRSSSVHLYVFAENTEDSVTIVASGSAYDLTTEEGIKHLGPLANFLTILAERKELPTELMFAGTNTIQTSFDDGIDINAD